MFKKSFLLLTLAYSFTINGAEPKFKLKELSADPVHIQEDLWIILEKAGMKPDTIKFEKSTSDKNQIKVKCDQNNDQLILEVSGSSEEWGSTFYYGLQKLGFLFPHPRIQKSPKLTQIKKHCGETYAWRPALPYRGFHLHTLHASEWVDGFLMGKSQIAEDLIRWLARNGQNAFDLSLVRMEDDLIVQYLFPLFEKARALGVHPGITIGIAFHQQNVYKLVSLWGSLFDNKSMKQIRTNFPKLVDRLPISFVNVEMGTSEFTPVPYERMLNWLNLVGQMTKKRGIQMLTKIHTSTNQYDDRYGNFNFLPQYADPSVGILPHTVFYHALEDPYAPLYGNENFKYMKDFMLQENSKRMTWYYPETSYYIALDIDIPLLLVEYLRTRTQDMKLLYKNGIPGVLNFTTGHENGYWLMDWQQALANNLDYNFDPMISLKLLGEDISFWKKYMTWQKKHFTDLGVISIVTFSNGGDEIAPAHKILKRNLLAELNENVMETKKEIAALQMALEEMPTPPTKGIDFELWLHTNITNLRVSHALYVRLALLDKDSPIKKMFYLEEAQRVRLEAQVYMDSIMKNYNRYPESFVYKKQKNPTAYPFGYGRASSNLHFWKREEMMVQYNNYSVFFMNIWDFGDILF